MSKIDEKVIDYAIENWQKIPTNSLYAINADSKLILHNLYKECAFVYSFYRIDNPPEPELVEVDSPCFKIYRLSVLTLSKPVGFIFIPTLPEGYFIRYSPYCVIATNKDIDYKSFNKIESRLLFSYDELEMVWMSNGVEVISDIWSKMGIFPEGDK